MQTPTCRLPAVQTGRQSELYDLAVRFAHVRRCRIAVDVHGRADVRMAHELLLYANWSPYRVNPTSGKSVETCGCRCARCPILCQLDQALARIPSPVSKEIIEANAYGLACA